MNKEFLTYDQQIELLKSKGLSISNESITREALERIGYFQLIGGYKHSFKNTTTKNYRDGVDFIDILWSSAKGV